MDESASMADESRLLDTSRVDGDGAAIALADGGGLGTVLWRSSRACAGQRGRRGQCRLDGRRAPPAGASTVDGDDTASAAARSGGLGTVLLAFLVRLFVDARPEAAEDESASMADERRLLDTSRADGDDAATAAPRGGGFGTVLLALLALPFVFLEHYFGFLEHYFGFLEHFLGF